MGRRVTNGLTGNIGSSISSLSVVNNKLITVTTDQNVEIDPNGSGHVLTDAPIESQNATASSSKVTGAITTTGVITAGSLDISGNADIDGTLEADAITVNGTALNTVIGNEATALAIALG